MRRKLTNWLYRYIIWKHARLSRKDPKKAEAFIRGVEIGMADPKDKPTVTFKM